MYVFIYLFIHLFIFYLFIYNVINKNEQSAGFYSQFITA